MLFFGPIFLLIIGLFTHPVYAESATCQNESGKATAAAKQFLDSRYGIQQLQIEWSAVDFCRQRGLGNQSEFAEAFAAALELIFSDHGDPESPLALIRHRRDLFDYIDRNTSVLSLVPLTEQGGHGENVAYNWIFKLKIPEFSDHIFWIVQDREGDEPAYIYGFN